MVSKYQIIYRTTEISTLRMTIQNFSEHCNWFLCFGARGKACLANQNVLENDLKQVSDLSIVWPLYPINETTSSQTGLAQHVFRLRETDNSQQLQGHHIWSQIVTDWYRMDQFVPNPAIADSELVIRQDMSMKFFFSQSTGREITPTTMMYLHLQSRQTCHNWPKSEVNQPQS